MQKAMTAALAAMMCVGVAWPEKPNVTAFPASDGMSVANGELFISLRNGVVCCYGK